MSRSAFCAAFLFVAVVTVLPGCMGGARVIRNDASSGVVVIPENTNVWPTYYQNNAIEAIRHEYGDDVQIDWGQGEEKVVGVETRNEQTSNRRLLGNEKDPKGEVVKNSTVTTTTDKKEYWLSFTIKRPGLMNNGLMQTGGFGHSNDRAPLGQRPNTQLQPGGRLNTPPDLDPLPTPGHPGFGGK